MYIFLELSNVVHVLNNLLASTDVVLIKVSAHIQKPHECCWISADPIWSA